MAAALRWLAAVCFILAPLKKQWFVWGQDDELMVWHGASNGSALCNDYSRAGFFLRRNSSSDRWIIFLESGSLCFSNGTCNRRFFRESVRPKGSDDKASAENPFGNFDPRAVHNSQVENNVSYSRYVNPLMTSMECLERSYFHSTGSGFAVEGKDILSADSSENGDFHSHNHVLIPYCSSDLWLSSEVQANAPAEASCSTNNWYTPDSSKLQFAFRGKIIFESIVNQLLEDHGLRTASSLILAGSSAGGIGVINHAQWVKDTLPSSVELRLIADSSWFINFQGNIERTFEVSAMDNTFSSDNPLMQTLTSHPACSDTTYGFPCCVSAQCMLTRKDEATDRLAYFPNDGVPMFFASSVYDVFLLAPSVVGSDNLDSANEMNQTQALIDFVTNVGEYGGEMNRSFARTFHLQPSLSYFLTQCFQHIYFATSSLWGAEKLFGTSSVGLTNDFISFEHSIEPGRWNLDLMEYSNFSEPLLSLKLALHIWYHAILPNEGKRFLDNCQGPFCNEKCPNSFSLGMLTSNNWSVQVKITLAAVVVGIGVACLLMKFLFKLWLYRLEKKQDDYLEQLEGHLQNCDSHLEFPDCDEEKAIAVSCLHLNYTITYKTSKKLKDERTDKTEAVVLSELAEQQREVAGVHTTGSAASHRVSRQLHRRSRFVQITGNLISSISGSTTNLHDVETGNNLEMTVPPVSNIPPPAPPPPPLPDISASPDEPVYNSCGCQQSTTKHILKDVSIYFNPGEMIGIMGPSGCGKTTFLDLLTGRRKSGTRTGDIYINGIPMEEVQDWYVANTGYVLQLAKPFYEEMTVRDNLTLAAEIKLPVSSKFTTKEKFKRVEQVMEVTGLSHLADTVVGGDIGPGLSGGQKRRLVVALQLLRLPSVIFLDEPTSGLDATSSMELLSHLNKLSDTNRTVILTIHQPRLEIFHMFHKLVLLSDGRVAYHGAPEKSYEVFVSALRARYLEQGLIIPSLEDHNPADVIMDMLGNPSFRRVLTEYYQESQEPKLVCQAIKLARFLHYDQSQSSINSIGSAFGLALHGARRVGRRHANMFVRMASLEARASKRLHFFQMMFLPLMFFLFATVLGTVYLQQQRAFLVISGMCVFSVASGLFVFPAIEPYYTPAIRVYRYEREDGVGQAGDLVIQGFVRYITLAFLPVIASCTLVYFLLVAKDAYEPLVYVQVILVNLCLNYTWTALLIALLMVFPTYAFRLSSVIASVAGFTSGFFIPIENINWAYRWLAYINPNYYGLSSVAFLILEDFNLCKGNNLTCYLQSGSFTLKQFFFDKVNPYFHISILLGFMTFFLVLGIVANWMQDTSLWSKLRRIISVLIIKKPADELSRQIRQDKEGFQRSLSVNVTLESEPTSYGRLTDDEFSPVHEKATTPLYPIAEGEEEEEEEEDEEEMQRKYRRERAMSLKRAKGNWWNLAGNVLMAEERESEEANEGNQEDDKGGKMGTVQRVKLNDSDPSRQASGAVRPSNIKLKNGTKITRRTSARTPFLREGETHFVWRPKKRPMLSDLVDMLKNREEDEPELTSYEQKESEANLEEELSSTTPLPPRTPKPTKSGSTFALNRSGSLRTRQQALFNRVIATQAVLKETTDELLKEDEPETPQKPKHMTLFEASKKVTANLKKQKKAKEGTKDFSDIVSEYLAKTKAEAKSSESSGMKDDGPKSAGYRGRMSMGPPRKHVNIQRKETKGAIPISQLREIVREERMQSEESRHKDNPKRNSAGPWLYSNEGSSAAASSTEKTTSTTEKEGEGVVTLDPPPTTHKLNKMAKLKKTVAERRPQRNEDVDTEVLSNMSNLEPSSSHNENLNSNSNNNNSAKKSFIGAHSDERDGSHQTKRVQRSLSFQHHKRPMKYAQGYGANARHGKVVTFNMSSSYPHVGVSARNPVATDVDIEPDSNQYHSVHHLASSSSNTSELAELRRHSASMYLSPKKDTTKSLLSHQPAETPMESLWERSNHLSTTKYSGYASGHKPGDFEGDRASMAASGAKQKANTLGLSQQYQKRPLPYSDGLSASNSSKSGGSLELTRYRRQSADLTSGHSSKPSPGSQPPPVKGQVEKQRRKLAKISSMGTLF